MFCCAWALLACAICSQVSAWNSWIQESGPPSWLQVMVFMLFILCFIFEIKQEDVGVNCIITYSLIIRFGCVMLYLTLSRFN